MKKVGPKDMRFWAIAALFFRFRKKKQKKNINLHHFQQLLFHTFPPPMILNFLVLVLMPRIFKSNAGDEIIISDHSSFFSNQLLGSIDLLNRSQLFEI